MTEHNDSPFGRLAAAVQSCGIPQEARLLVAVSGGSDSVALLHILHRLSDTARFSEVRATKSISVMAGQSKPLRQPVVAHVNHSLRGAESDEDEAFVRRLCSQLGLEMRVQRVDVLHYAEEHRLSTEVAARLLRWASLRQMLLYCGCNFIVTGHTLTDHAETLLMRLLRGSGTIGLGGMKRKDADIVRPFLELEHRAILEYLSEEGISYRKDSSNVALSHLRNRIRMETFPKLIEVQPRLSEVLGRTSQLLSMDADFLLKEASEALEVMDLKLTEDEIGASRGSWLALHPALKGHTLRRLIQQLTSNLTDVEESHIKQISAAIEREDCHEIVNQLPGNLTLYIDATRFTIRRGPKPVLQKLPLQTVQIPGRIELVGGVLGAVLQAREAIDVERMKAVCGRWHALCDAHRLGEYLTIRARRPGDAVRPLGSPGRRKLKEIMIDRHVPREARDSVPVIESSESIVWVVGIALAQDAAITTETQDVMHLTFKPSGTSPWC